MSFISSQGTLSCLANSCSQSGGLACGHFLAIEPCVRHSKLCLASCQTYCSQRKHLIPSISRMRGKMESMCEFDERESAGPNGKRYSKSNPRMKPSLPGLTESRRWECVTKYSRLVGLASPTEMPLKKNAGWRFKTLENGVCFPVSQSVVGFSRTQSCAWHRPCEILQCLGILHVQGVHLGPFRSSKTCPWRCRKAGKLIVREGFICCESPALVNNTSG